MNRRMFIKKISAALGLLALPVMVMAGKKPISYPFKKSGSSKSITARMKMRIWTYWIEQGDPVGLVWSWDGLPMKIQIRMRSIPLGGFRPWDKIIVKWRQKTLYAGYIAQIEFDNDHAVLYCENAVQILRSRKFYEQATHQTPATLRPGWAKDDERKWINIMGPGVADRRIDRFGT